MLLKKRNILAVPSHKVLMYSHYPTYIQVVFCRTLCKTKFI